MSLKPIDPQRSFYHTSTLCGEMFAPTDRYRLFREKILPKLFALRDKLESLYCENNGRPAGGAVFLAGGGGCDVVAVHGEGGRSLGSRAGGVSSGLEVRFGSRAERGRVSCHGLGVFSGSIGGKQGRASDL